MSLFILLAKFMHQLRLVIIVLLTMFLHQYATAQTIVRVDGANGSPNPPGQGNTWGAGAYKFLQDALALAEANATPANPYHLWVAATDPSNPYRPDKDAANPDGTRNPSATFDLDFDNITILGGFAGSETDPLQRNPEMSVTVLSGNYIPGICGDPNSGNCFVETLGIPGCSDEQCCFNVCEDSPYCCDTEWDEVCAAFATALCGPPSWAVPGLTMWLQQIM